ncbi:nestin-like, partial [Trifolium medium]|nr:nestin-like [Trifolium medium]
MLRLSEKTCNVADPEECIGFSLNELEASTTKGSEAETYFDQTTVGDVMETYNRKESMEVTAKGSEAETYFDQTTHGDVMETYNRKESMQVDKMEKENNQEDKDCTSDQ